MTAVQLNGEPQPEGQVRLETMRSWLHNGARLVDRRRRYGGHGRARELLVLGPEDHNGISERWQALASSLNRHTVNGALSELTPEQRHVITLAYLEGQTNKQIAAALGVSVTTARRRLWAALQRLEAYITGVGIWLTAFALTVAIFASAQSVRLGRWVGSLDRLQKVAATVAAGAVAAGAVGVVALRPATPMPAKAAAPPVAGVMLALRAIDYGRPAPAKGGGWHTTTTLTPATVTFTKIEPAKTAGEKDDKDKKDDGDKKDDKDKKGCHGNPTGAPPVTPVRSHGAGSPVHPPGRGGCKALAA